IIDLRFANGVAQREPIELNAFPKVPFLEKFEPTPSGLETMYRQPRICIEGDRGPVSPCRANIKCDRAARQSRTRESCLTVGDEIGVVIIVRRIDIESRQSVEMAIAHPMDKRLDEPANRSPARHSILPFIQSQNPLMPTSSGTVGW